MTDEELAREKSIEGLSDEERLRFFALMRKMHGATVTVYDADDSSLVYTFRKEVLRDIPHGSGLQFELDRTGPRVILAHIAVGPWEFWQDIRGRDHPNGNKVYNVSLP